MRQDNPLAKKDNVIRNKKTFISGVVAMCVNVALAALKIVCGALFGAISIIADGLNNLSDCGNNVVVIVGAKMSAKPADKEHPYGHARGEYVTAMVVAFSILVLAAELLLESAEKIYTGSTTEFSPLSIVVLSVGIAAKLLMFFFNRRTGKKYEAEIPLAIAADSIGDALSSALVLIGLIVSHFSGFSLDGYIGCLIALIIAISGIKIIKRTVSELLGESPNKQLTDEIKRTLLSYEGVFGIHDLAVHNYVNKLYASVHVEVNADISVLAAHELIDKIEKDFEQNTDISLTIHMDPVVLDDPAASLAKSKIEDVLSSLDGDFTMHDFRYIAGVKPKAIFEITVPYEKNTAESQKAISAALDNALGENMSFSFTVEHELIR